MTKKGLFSYLVCSLFLLIQPARTGAQQWSNPIKLAKGNTPDIVVDRNSGKVHILIMDNKVVYVVTDRDGNKLSQEDIPNTSGVIGKYRFGATIAVERDGTPHVAYHRHIGNDYYDAFYTYQSGSGWKSPLQFASNIWRGYAIRMAIDDDGDVHLVQGIPDVVGQVGGTATYYRIKDGKIVQTIAGLQKWRIEQHVEIDTYGDNDVHIVLSRPDNNGKVYYHYSTDNGNSFTGPIDLRNGNGAGRPGSADVFTDLFGTAHFVYGTGEDQALNINPSVRYHRRQGGPNKIRDVQVTDPGELLPWHLSTGIGTVAASDNGRQIVVAYVTTDGGELRARFSSDQGATWSSPTILASQAGCCETRDKPVVRANGRRFYLVYESGGSVWLRWIQLPALPPLADAGGPYAGSEGQLISFDASGSTADGVIAQYAWDWQSDGVYDDTTTSAIIQHAYPDDFVGQATLRVRDKDGATDTAMVSVTISNVAPSLSIQAPVSASEGAQISFLASITDPGNDVFGAVSWDFGDGVNATGTNPTHAFADDGQYTIQATVTDDDGGSGTAQHQITITNAPPAANAGGPYTAVVNESVTFTGSATDPGVNDVLSFSWDLDNDGSFERTGAQATTIFTATGAFTIRFRATDDDGASDIDETQVFVGIGAPNALAIPDQITDEGNAFPPLNLDLYVDDPNNADSDITWSAYGNANLQVTLANQTATVAPGDSNWWGDETIYFVATDPSGLSDTTAAKFIVRPVNDPPVISKIPPQTVIGDAQFAPVHLDNYVTDIDDPKSVLLWRATGNSALQVSINNRVATITRPGTNWFGAEIITFIVSDTSGTSDSTGVRFAAKQFNEPPVLSQIPSQTIKENQSFSAIRLDDYVDDPDDADEVMSWSVFGQKELRVTLNAQRLVTIAPPDSEWAKSEQISFVVRDPFNNADTSTATFTVEGINDPPVLSGFGTYTINEDDTLLIPLSQLQSMVVDPDNALSELQYGFIGKTNLRVAFIDGRGLALFSQEDWYGEETAWLRVSDGDAWNIVQVKLIVISQPDAPKPFDLIEPVFNANYLTIPETITFKWRATTDPDAGDSLAYYIWELSWDDAFSSIISRVEPVKDTTLVFQARFFLRPPTTFDKYFWRVLATSTDGSRTANRLQGRFTIGVVTAVNDDDDVSLPQQITLHQNYPNPFNPSTRIVFELPHAQQIHLQIYDVTGHLIRELVNGRYGAGRHEVTWDARDEKGRRVSSGLYVYQLKTSEGIMQRKMLLLQ